MIRSPNSVPDRLASHGNLVLERLYRGVVGLRYDLSPNAALKAEFNRTKIDNPSPQSFDELFLQWAIRF